MLVDVASTMWPGSAFHTSITRLEKKCFLISNLALVFSSFSVCPLDLLSLMLKWAHELFMCVSVITVLWQELI